jgi:hypothetical protein
MPMDNPSGESNASLSVRDAASLFMAPEPEQKAQPEAKAEETPKEAPKEPTEATQADTETETVEDASAEPEKVTIEVDGKTVELTKAELADYYKNGLRQADYTRKTMEVAEQRKAAEAESAKARDERQKASQALNHAQTLLASQLNEQSQIDWHALREQNPTEFLKEWHLFTERQAKYQQLQGQSQQLASIERAEAKKALVEHMTRESQATLEKIPEWKDEKKAVAEKQAIVKELLERGFERDRILGETDSDGTPKLENPGLTDHRILLLARDAMLYRQMMERASVASKKVPNLPQKVEKPGGGETNPQDGRTTAMKQLAKSGSVRDAASVFERMFK